MSNFNYLAHDDHELLDCHMDFIFQDSFFDSWEDGEFVKTIVQIPDGMPSLSCSLIGPSVGDFATGETFTDGSPSGLASRLANGQEMPAKSKIKLIKRGNRKGPSKIANTYPRACARNMVVIGIKGRACFTAYGTRADKVSPMEPWDAHRKLVAVASPWLFKHAETQEEIPQEVKDAVKVWKESSEFWSLHALADKELWECSPHIEEDREWDSFYQN